MLAGACVVGLALGAAPNAGGRAIPRSNGGLIGRTVGCGRAVTSTGPTGARGATTPVLLVHGFAGRPSDFRRTLNGYPSLLKKVRALPGAAVFTFDYSAHSLEWVTDPAIGPALARAIDCLSIAYARPAIVVAHSMGGLAAQYAQGQVLGGGPVAGRLAGVIAIGTPFDGAQFLGVDGGPSAFVFDRFRDAALDVCDEPRPTRPRRQFCDLIGATATPAVRAMRKGSSKLRALPDWDSRVRIVALTGDIVFSIGAFGATQDIGVGDIAVAVDSATTGATSGTRPFVARCRESFFDVAQVFDTSPCAHTNEVANRRIVAQVADRVRDALRRSIRMAR